jgi:hypothetical protein
MTTIYEPQASGRTLYIFWSLFFAAIGLFLLFTLMTAPQSEQTWLVYFFALPVTMLWLSFAVVCLLKFLKYTPRVVVTETGFTYHGILKKQTFLWSNLVSVNHPRDRGGFRWLTVTANSDSNKTTSCKLDFTGLSPDYMAFINQVREFSPSAIIKIYSSRITFDNPRGT